jgi:Lipocalin-like domain
MNKAINLSIGILISALFHASSVIGQVNTSSIQGSWETIELKVTSKDSTKTSTPFRSILIFSDKFYSTTSASVDRPSWPTIPNGEKVSYENLSNAYQNFTSNAGHYEIKGDSIIYKIIVAKSPNYMNDIKTYSQAFTLQGDKLITLSTSASGQKTTTTYKRLQ